MFLRETASIKNRIAIEDDFENRMTYGELETLSREYLKLIPSRNLVFILCDYSIETVAFYYCMMTSHVVPLLLDKDLDADMLQNLVDLYQPRYLWGREERLSQLKEARPLKQVRDHLIAETGYDAPEMDGRLALLLTTSGSTGSPKLVRLSYDNIRAEAAGAVLALKIVQDDKLATTLPMNYCYGLCLLHIHWMSGGTVCVTEHSLLHACFWEMIRRHGVTNFSGVPFSFEMLEKVHFFDKDVPSLRLLMVGGGGLSHEIWNTYCEQSASRGIRFYMGYGQTEVLAHVIGFLSSPNGERWGCIGVPDPGVEAAIGKDNELIVCGACVCLGYAEAREDLAHGDDNHGVLHTGDIAYPDEDGFLYLRGRLKRFLKMTGARVSLDELEGLLGQAFSGCDFACVGQDDDLRVFHTGEVDARTIVRFCQTRLGMRRDAVTVRQIGEFPRNPAGKIMYQELERYEREDR